MVSDDKPMKPDAVAQSDAPASKTTESDVATTKSESSGEKDSAAPAGHSRGEGQKPVSKAYKENWNAIFGKK